MSLITNLRIDKIIILQDEKKLDKIVKLLEELNDTETKQIIMDKLDTIIEDIKQTI